MKCKGTKLSNICIECNPTFVGVKKSGEIKSCEIPCETWIKEKCSRCNTEKNIIKL